jgi:hypothetical protein
MKVRKTLIATAVAALIPLGAAALAGEGGYDSKDKAGASATFKQLDANKDGKISQAEAAVDSTIVFSTADVNGDGYIDATEWKAAMSKKQQDSSTPRSMPSDPAPSEQAPSDTQEPSSTPSPDTETPPQ